MSRDTDRPRFAGANWDKPEVEIKRTGGKSLERKVLTTGTRKIDATRLLDDIRQLMRQGFEVRLTCNGQDALRFVPLSDRECSKIEPHAFFMGKMAKMLGDKKLKITRNGEEVPQSDVQELVDHMREMARVKDDKRHYVTPDTVVTCPNCGTEFRVGRPNKE